MRTIQRSILAAAAAVFATFLSATAHATSPLSLQPNASAPAQIALEFTSDAVVASNVTPGGDVLWFGRSVEYAGGVPKLVRYLRKAPDDDRDGVVRWTLPVPTLSVWTATDLRTGSFTAGAPNGFDVRALPLPNDAWRGGVTHIDVRRDLLDVVLIRPHVGIWNLRAFEGGSLDADNSSNGTLRASVARMKPVGGSPPAPPTATPHDVLIVIDPRALDVFVRDAKREDLP